MAAPSAPRRSKTPGATAEAAPLAQSSTTAQAVEPAALERRPRGGRRSASTAAGLGGEPSRRRRRSGRAGGRAGVARAAASSSSSTAASASSGSLVPPGAEQLDAVVGEGVVRGRDHRRRARPRSAHEGHPGRREHAEVDDVGPLGGQAGRQRGLQQRARAAGVAADQEAGARQDPGRGPAEGEGQLGASARRWRPPGCRRCRNAAAPRRATAWSTAEPCGPSSGRTSCSPSRGRRG